MSFYLSICVFDNTPYHRRKTTDIGVIFGKVKYFLSANTKSAFHETVRKWNVNEKLYRKQLGKYVQYSCLVIQCG